MMRWKKLFPDVDGDKRATVQIGTVEVEENGVWLLWQIRFGGSNRLVSSSALQSRGSVEDNLGHVTADLGRELEAAGWKFDVDRLPRAERDSLPRIVSIVAAPDASHEGYDVRVTGEIDPNGEGGCGTSLPEAIVPLGVYQKGIDKVLKSGLWKCLDQGWSVQRIRIEDRVEPGAGGRPNTR